jgi:hypothetical protein
MLFRALFLLLEISCLPLTLASKRGNHGCKSWSGQGEALLTSNCENVGQSPNPKPTSPPPVNFGMLLFRSFEPLDVFGPLEALYMLSRIRHLNLFLISETMEVVTTQPVVAAMNPMNSTMVSGCWFLWGWGRGGEQIGRPGTP